MIKFNFDNFSDYNSMLENLLTESVDRINIISYKKSLNIFMKKLTEELEKVTLLTYEHEYEVLLYIRDVLDFLPKDYKRSIKHQIRLHFRR